MKTPTVLILVVLIATVMDTAYPLSSSGSKCAKGIQSKSRRGLKGHLQDETQLPQGKVFCHLLRENSLWPIGVTTLYF